jgi:hypothetical protein
MGGDEEDDRSGREERLSMLAVGDAVELQRTG